MSFYLDISRNWAYLGFSYDFHLAKLLFSSFCVLFFVFIARCGDDLISFFQGIAILLILCPASVIFGLGGASVEYYLSCLIGLALLFLTSSLKVHRMIFTRISQRSFLTILVALTAFSILGMIAFGGLRYFNLNILNVYEFRRTAAALLPSIFGYITSPVSKVIIPIGVVLGIYYRSNFVIIIFILMTILMFGLTHHKSVLLAPLAALAFYTSLRRYSVQKSLAGAFLIVALVAVVELVVLTIMDYRSSGIFSAFIIRRAFFVPPLLDNYYVEYFLENPMIYWAFSRISFGLVSTGYDMTAPFIIGEHFFGRIEMSANTGFIGSGFSNLGFAGVALYGALLGLILSILDAHGRAVGHPFVICASLIVVTTAMTSSDLVTVILTHGLLFLILCLALMPSAASGRRVP